MLITRRKAVLTTLFGTGLVGLRSFATGLSTGFLLNPRKAMADSDAGASCTPTPGKAQFVIYATSGGGDPVMQNAPGTYGPDVFDNQVAGQMVPPPVHPPDNADPNAGVVWSNAGQFASTIAGTKKTFTTAKVWSDLAGKYGWLAARMQFFHMMTNIQIHSQESNALRLNGYTYSGDMLASLLAAQLQPMLCTIQPQPISVGALSPLEAISFQGAAQPIIPPTALKATLVAPNKGALVNIARLRGMRDKTLNDMMPIYKSAGSPAQKAYVDAMVNADADLARAVQSSAVANLAAIADNGPSSQLQAAIILFQLKVTPVVAVHLPFGGDNHFDASLQKEAQETSDMLALPSVAGKGFLGDGGALANLVDYLDSTTDTIAGFPSTPMRDMVTFLSHNVFGRTFVVNAPTSDATTGRNHNFQYQGSLVIGQSFKGGVVGGLAAAPFFAQQDYAAASIDPGSGGPVASGASGSIDAADTACAFAQTVLQGVGADPSVVLLNGKSGPNGTGKVVTAALAGA